MKRLLILFLIVLLLAGCSNEVPKVNNTPDVNKEIDLNNDKNDEPANSSQETSGEDKEAASEDQLLKNPEEPIKTEEPIETEESPIEKPVAPVEPAEPVKEEPQESAVPVNKDLQEPAVATEDDQNILKIKGLVANEQKFSLNDLKEMKDIVFEADFYSLNSYGTTGYTHFKGIKLWNLLESYALIKPEASKVTIIAQDGYSVEFTVEQIKMEYMDETNPDNKYPMIIAWEENGKEYSIDDGAPYKLVVGQKEPGDVNKPQWISNIDIIIIE